MEQPRESEHLHWEFPELEDIRLQLHGRTLIVAIILFSVLVLSTFLFLYARWIRRSRQHTRSSSHDTHGARRAQPPPSRGLGLAAINGIPVILVGNGGMESTECCICLAEFEDGEKVKVLPRCRHAFHCECVDRWLRSESNCPLCRESLRAESELTGIVTE